MPDILMPPNLPIDLLMAIKTTANKLGIIRIALVGGIVRDGLLDQLNLRPWEKPRDIDIVIEGSAIELARELKVHLEAERISKVRIHSTYKTVEMKVDEVLIDMATARTERYPAPGENPNVTSSKIEQDLGRRDFTINAMAIDLSGWNLIDPYKGIKALKNAQLEFLHPKSVEEDPTRIIRGARYSSRLHFKMTPTSIKQIQSSLENWPWNWLPGEPVNLAPPSLSTRLRLELELLLKEERWDYALTYLQKWGAFVLLDESLQNDQRWKRRMFWASRLKIKPLTALIAGTGNSLSVAERLQLPKQEYRLIAESLKLRKSLALIEKNDNYNNWPPSRWCNELEKTNWSVDAIAITICIGLPMWRPLLKWWGRWRHISSPISAKELMNKGWQSGPELGAELNRLRKEQLDKLLK